MALGGLHVTSLPEEAAQHADTIFLGPGEDTWPAFLADYRAGASSAALRIARCARWSGLPRIRRDLIKRSLYLVPNSIVVSRGCPHVCDFCYKEAFFKGGKSFYTQQVDDALGRDRASARPAPLLPRRPSLRQSTLRRRPLRRHARDGAALAGGRHGAVDPAARICWRRRRHAACAACSSASRRSTRRTCRSSTSTRTSTATTPPRSSRLHDLGVMVNGSFVFGMDDDDATVFDRTVEWAIAQGIETATFHILTPYPGHRALHADGRRRDGCSHSNWDLYDTRHVVYRPAKLTPEALEAGYWRAYRDFYRWGSIVRGAWTHETLGRATAPRGLRWRLEEAGADVGLHHSCQTRVEHAAGTRNGASGFWLPPPDASRGNRARNPTHTA